MIIEGMVGYDQTSDTGDYDYDHDWKIGGEYLLSIIEKYKGDRVRIIIEEIPKDAVCQICGEEVYSDELAECSRCGKGVCNNCYDYDDSYDYICNQCK